LEFHQLLLPSFGDDVREWLMGFGRVWEAVGPERDSPAIAETTPSRVSGLCLYHIQYHMYSNKLSATVFTGPFTLFVYYLIEGV
jgi:hypothetical protein